MCLTGFLIAPVAALIVDDQYAIGREMAVVAFGALLATFGVERLWTSTNTRARAIAAGLLMLVPLQFAYFCTDYFTGYRQRAALWFGNNLPGAMERLIAMEPPDTGRRVYISDAIPHSEWYWAFYLAKHHRTDLLARTERFDSWKPPHAESLLPGTLLLSTIDDAREAALTATGQIQRVVTSYDPDGTPFFGVLERSATR